jgi:flagellar biosynthesis regulator FlbT
MNPEKTGQNSEKFYQMVDTVINNIDENSFTSFFKVVQELKKMDPKFYAYKLIEKITTARDQGKLSREDYDELWHIIREA